MYHLELTLEERNLVLALIDAGLKATGNQLLKEGGGALAQSAYDKLANAKPKPEADS